jgi:hypothetical protein
LQGDPWNICLHGCDNTGWLPEDDDPVHDRSRAFISMFRELPLLTKDEATSRATAAIDEVKAARGYITIAPPQRTGTLEELVVSNADTPIAAIFAKHGLMLYAPVLVKTEAGDWMEVRAVGYRDKERSSSLLHETRISEK